MTQHFRLYNGPVPQKGRLADISLVSENDLHILVDAMAIALMVIDGNARILYANETARRMIRSHAALSRSSTHLTAATGKDNAVMRSAIAQAAAGETAGTIPLCDSESRVSAMAWVGSIQNAERTETAKADAKVGVAIRDMTAYNRSSLDLFAASYKLTKTETKLLKELAKCQTLGVASEALNISVNTAKTHLHRIFGKTGVNRQVDLIALVGRADFPMFEVSLTQGKGPLSRPKRDMKQTLKLNYPSQKREALNSNG